MKQGEVSTGMSCSLSCLTISALVCQQPQPQQYQYQLVRQQHNGNTVRKKGWQVRCFVHQVFEGLVNRSAEFGVVQHHPTTWCVEPVRHRETAHTAHLQVLAADNIRRPDPIMFTVWSLS